MGRPSPLVLRLTRLAVELSSAICSVQLPHLNDGVEYRVVRGGIVPKRPAGCPEIPRTGLEAAEVGVWKL